MAAKEKSMEDRRSALRQKSFLQGRIFYNSRRSSVDCLIRDISDTGAKLKFSESITVPEVMELFIPTKDEFRRARVQWRYGGEMGVAFGEAVDSPETAPTAMPVADLAGRVQRLEAEILSLKRIVNELRAENRKAHGEVV